MTGQDWVLVALIAGVTQYKTIALCLRHRATRQAAERKAQAGR